MKTRSTFLSILFSFMDLCLLLLNRVCVLLCCKQVSLGGVGTYVLSAFFSALSWSLVFGIIPLKNVVYFPQGVFQWLGFKYKNYNDYLKSHELRSHCNVNILKLQTAQHFLKQVDFFGICFFFWFC